MMNRKYKILPHLFLDNYDASMYVDANIAIIKNPKELFDKYLAKYDFLMPKHFSRNCIYDEAEACIQLRKAHVDETQKQIEYYKSKNYPENFGLGENNILIRSHNKENIIKLMNDWWNELNIHTQRDQLSLGYVLWKNKMKFNFMGESARGDGYFRIKLHSLDYKNGLTGLILNIIHEHLSNYPNGKIVRIITKIKNFLTTNK